MISRKMTQCGLNLNWPFIENYFLEDFNDFEVFFLFVLYFVIGGFFFVLFWGFWGFFWWWWWGVIIFFTYFYFFGKGMVLLEFPLNFSFLFFKFN